MILLAVQKKNQRYKDYIVVIFQLGKAPARGGEYSPAPRPRSPTPREDLRGPRFTLKNIKNYKKKYIFFVLSQFSNNNKFKV